MKKYIDRRSLLELSTTVTAAASVGSTKVFTRTMPLPVRATTTGPVGYWKFACRPPDMYDQHFYLSAAGMVNDSTPSNSYIRSPSLC